MSLILFSPNMKFFLKSCCCFSTILYIQLLTQTTAVYQLQRKVKGLREAVERKDLHVDMLRRKLALTEDAARASRHLEEERDDILSK